MSRSLSGPSVPAPRRRWAPALAAVSALTASCLIASAPAHAAAAPALRAGAGQADITPPQTGYYMGGWTRADRKVEGTQSRLWAKVIVLQRGDRKIALVSVNLFMVPGGWQRAIAEQVADLGFAPDNVVISASHTHAGPGGFANYPTLNTASPNLGMILTNPTSLSTLLIPVSADRQLYTFLVKQVASAIRDADADLAPAEAGWGEQQLVGLTQNRSIEGHLADHGIIKNTGAGKVSDDPGGYIDTIDPNVDVLRVDHIVDGQHVPIGAWSQFADHGTVEKSELRAYNADHHAAAMQIFEAGVRKEGDVPAGRPVVNVYGNSDEGDQSAGLQYTGPAGAQQVGTVEGNSMLAAWRQAGAAMTSTPDLDWRWTQTCFCGQVVDGVKSSAKGNPGLPFITGSEEGRGPLYDVTNISFEGVKAPGDLGGGQGDKIVVPVGEFPKAVPLTVVRVGDRMIASLPGEPTKEAGTRVKAAVLEASRAAGVRKVVISGLTNEYINYISTPEEYDTQNYEGASTMFGRSELGVLKAGLIGLTSDLVSGVPSSRGTDYDATRGVLPNGAPYPAGATSGTITTQPASTVPRLSQASISWQGGPAGHDMPVGSPFIRAEKLVGGQWQEVTNDLGLQMLWRVGTSGNYTAKWDIPVDEPKVPHRLVVTATGYRLQSNPFLIGNGTALKATKVDSPAGTVRVQVGYNAPVENVDLTARPAAAAGGTVRFTAYSGATYTAPIVNGYAQATVPGTISVYVTKGSATDTLGNTNGAETRVR